MAIVLDEPSFGELILNYFLVAGAIFQLICIFAVIIVPSGAEDNDKIDESSNTPVTQTSQNYSKPSHDNTGRRSKKEKKKHR